MLFDFNFYSSLLLVFFTNGLLYSFLLFKKGFDTATAAPKWLAFFILLCSLFIAPWMLGFAGWYDTQPYRDIIFYIPFRHLYFIGPTIYFYVQSLLNPKFTFSSKSYLHLLPGISYIIYNIIIVVTDKLILKEYYFLANGSDREFDAWYSVSGLLLMFLYFAASLRYYKLYRKIISQVVSYADTITFKWIKNFLVAFLLMLLVRVVFDLITLAFPEVGSYTGTWWFFFIFAIITCYIAISGYNNTLSAEISFNVSLLTPEKATVYYEEKESEIMIESDDTTNDEDLAAIKSKITALFDTEEAYTNPELTLPLIATTLNLPAALISKTINKGFGINFNDFVNSYRVEAVKRAFENGDQQKQTLLGIAFTCGFNSKATFNRAFKKHTGLSPSMYVSSVNSILQ